MCIARGESAENDVGERRAAHAGVSCIEGLVALRIMVVYNSAGTVNFAQAAMVISLRSWPTPTNSPKDHCTMGLFALRMGIGPGVD